MSISKNETATATDNKYLMVWYDNLKGVKLDETNAKDVARWIGSNARVVNVDGVNLISVTTNRGDIIMALGDYITIDADRRFKIVRIEDMVDLKQRAIQAWAPKPTAIPTPKNVMPMRNRNE